MKRRVDLIGLPVIAAETGEKLGEVDDVVFDPSVGEVIGYLLEAAGRGGRRRLVPRGAVSSVGPGAVMVSGGRDAIRTVKAAEVRRLQGLAGRILGKRVLTGEGDDLGTVDDMVFDPQAGLVTGYQLSGGPVDDWLAGKEILTGGTALTAGPDALIVERPRTLPPSERGTGQ